MTKKIKSRIKIASPRIKSIQAQTTGKSKLDFIDAIQASGKIKSLKKKMYGGTTVAKKKMMGGMKARKK